MKQLMMLLVCVALVVPSVGCCWSHGAGYGGGGGGGGCCPPGGACGTPYGYAPQYQQGAYYGGTTATAGITPYSQTAYGQQYPTTAYGQAYPATAYGQYYPTTAGINPLPTY